MSASLTEGPTGRRVSLARVIYVREQYLRAAYRAAARRDRWARQLVFRRGDEQEAAERVQTWQRRLEVRLRRAWSLEVAQEALTEVAESRAARAAWEAMVTEVRPVPEAKVRSLEQRVWKEKKQAEALAD